MKILITGVAGFIGSNLAVKLIELDQEVIGIDNLSYGFERNIHNIRHHRNFQFILGDIANPLILKDCNTDIIVHLASQKIPRYTNALRVLEENYIMLKNIINKCMLDKSKIIFASTSDVYGKNDKLPFSEESDLVIGSTKVKRWAYALSKMYGEQLIIANHDQFGLTYTIARFFGSYGPHQNLTWWGGPQSVFITNAIKNQPIELHGNGLQTRSFTYIDDTINALLSMIFNEKSHHEVFNTGSYPEEEVSIKALADIIWRLVNGEKSEPKINYIPYSNFGNYEDVMRRVPDITKLKNLLNFRPEIKLIDGLVKTIEWQKSILTS